MIPYSKKLSKFIENYDIKQKVESTDILVVVDSGTEGFPVENKEVQYICANSLNKLNSNLEKLNIKIVITNAIISRVSYFDGDYSRCIQGPYIVKGFENIPLFTGGEKNTYFHLINNAITYGKLFCYDETSDLCNKIENKISELARLFPNNKIIFITSAPKLLEMQAHFEENNQKNVVVIDSFDHLHGEVNKKFFQNLVNKKNNTDIRFNFARNI